MEHKDIVTWVVASDNQMFLGLLGYLGIFGFSCYTLFMLHTLLIHHIDTPIGSLEVSGTENGISSIAFVESSIRVSEYPSIRQCADQLQSYFDGNLTAFHSLQLHYGATDFQRSVWDALMKIPFGETVTYGELAERAGHKGAARAVGTAMNVNPLPIIIPCHRVLPAEGDIGEYAFGAERKRWLLEHEQRK